MDYDEHDVRMIRRIRWLAVGCFLFFTAWNHGAFAHDVWANGSPVPSWVKASCCGPRDAHDLTLEGIGWHEVRGGYQIEGIDMVVPIARTQPSLDGHAWAFYWIRTPTAQVYCLFLPMGF